MKTKILSLIFFLAVVFVVATFGSIGTSLGVQTWYPGLSRPIWSPPNWVFPPMWTLLYITIAVAAWMCWNSARGFDRVFPMTLWGVQLFLNGVWSWIFFAYQSPYYALIDIGILWIFIALTMASFWPVNRWATIALLPYFGWVSYAAALNFWIYQLNA